MYWAARGIQFGNMITAALLFAQGKNSDGWLFVFFSFLGWGLAEIRLTLIEEKENNK